MLIKISKLEKGDRFMFKSYGASTVYVVDSVEKVSQHMTKLVGVGALSGRKRTFTKLNPVRVIVFQ